MAASVIVAVGSPSPRRSGSSVRIVRLPKSAEPPCTTRPISPSLRRLKKVWEPTLVSFTHIVVTLPSMATLRTWSAVSSRKAEKVANVTHPVSVW